MGFYCRGSLVSHDAAVKHYCHAFLHHGRKCLSPCVRRQPRASSAAVNNCCRTLQTLLIRPAFRLEKLLCIAEAWNGFGFTHQVRGSLWLQPPWDEPRTTPPRVGSVTKGIPLRRVLAPRQHRRHRCGSQCHACLLRVYYVWEFRDWNTRGYQCLGVPHGNAGGLLTCLFSVAVRTWMPATCIVHMIVDEFSRINADIDIDIMTAYMKDQYFGDVDMLHQRFLHTAALAGSSLAYTWIQSPH